MVKNCKYMYMNRGHIVAPQNCKYIEKQLMIWYETANKNYNILSITSYTRDLQR